jgi:bifunctional DNA-binding transcriptional regulator/antitoxin component of YhaV-PrlF toxin-antitoxin module
MRQADLPMDEQGRVYIPKSIRKQLGVNGESADLRLKIQVIDDG